MSSFSTSRSRLLRDNTRYTKEDARNTPPTRIDLTDGASDSTTQPPPTQRSSPSQRSIAQRSPGRRALIAEESIVISRQRKCVACTMCSLMCLAVVSVGIFVVLFRVVDNLPPVPPSPVIRGECHLNNTVYSLSASLPPPAPQNFTLAASYFTVCLAAVANKSAVIELQMDDWWNFGGFSTIATIPSSSTNLTLNFTNLLPRVPYQLRLQVRSTNNDTNTNTNTNTTSPFSSTTLVITQPAGYCGNTADMEVYRATKNTMKAGIQDCLKRCVASGEDCAVSCIQSSVGLSSNCARCWGEEGLCTLKNCVLPCLNPSSQACSDCSESKCFPRCVECSGVPQWAFPP